MCLLAALACQDGFGQAADANADAGATEREIADREIIVVRGTIVSGFDASGAIFRSSLDADQIARLNAPDVPTLLRSVPGIDAATQGAGGGPVYVSIRGGDPNFTVVLIDGVQVDDPTNAEGGGFDFSGLDPLMIERIEVFYGSFSAVFGSSALGGVISITTKGAAATQVVDGTVEVGTDNALAGAARLSTVTANGIHAAISASARDAAEAVDGNSLEQKQAALHLGQTTGGESNLTWKINLFGSDTDATAFPTASGGDQLAVIRDTEERDFEQRTAGGYLAWTLMPVWRMELRGNWSEYEEFSDSPAIVPGELPGIPPVLTDSAFERKLASVSNSFFVSDRLTLALGGEVAEEDGSIESIIDFGFPVPASFALTRDTWAIFGEASYTGGNYTILGSVRHDDVEDESSTNSRLAASYDIRPERTKLWFSYSEGFKMPSLFALGHSLTGNPDLKPESSESWSGTLENYFGEAGSSVALTLFRNEFEDLVDFDADTFRHVNRASAETKGVELSARSPLTTTFDVRGYVGYLDGEVSDGTKLENRPEWRFGLDAAWRPTKALSFNLNAYGNDGVYSLSVPTGVTSLDGYVRFDAGVQWLVSEHVVLKGQIDNVFDTDYEEIVGFSPQGRQARVAISLRQ